MAQENLQNTDHATATYLDAYREELDRMAEKIYKKIHEANRRCPGSHTSRAERRQSSRTKLAKAITSYQIESTSRFTSKAHCFKEGKST